MSIKKYTDWSTWLEGLRTNLIKCIGTTGTALLGTNGIANLGIDAFKGFGITWEQALGFFGIHLVWEACAYFRDNQPKVIVESVETTHMTRDASGAIESGSSKTVTTTPVNPPPP